MFHTPSKTGRPTATRSTKGLFKDGTWFCNCDPRQPAARFQVKQDTSNKGRWFYNCKKHSKRSDNCKYFLWEDQARLREGEGARPSTPEHQYNEPSPTPPTTPSVASCNKNKRKYDELDEGSDSDFGGFELSPEMAEMLTRASQTSSTPIPTPQTPRKAAKSSDFATPGPGIRTGLPTPVTGGFTNRESRDMQTPSASPNESVERRAEMGKTGYVITDDVMEVLKGKVDAQICSQVQVICDKFGAKLSGIEKGRDISRVALKSKDEKIEELRTRVASLEAELEKKKAVIKAMADSM